MRTHGYIFDKSATKRFRFEADAWDELPVVSWIRRYDSKIFWNVIDKHKADLTYLAEKVGWREGETGYDQEIDGYLDFLQTLTHPRCMDLYRIAMQRFAGLFPKQNVMMVPLDRLAVTLAEEFNADQPSYECRKNIVRLGSVYVSGRTLDAFGKPDSALETVHFFLHSSGILPAEKSRSSLLLWCPVPWGKDVDASDEGRDETSPRYGRIGKTHAVGRDGRKHFLIPRIDVNGEPIQARTPAQTYDDWQQPLIPLLSSGHWQYESHHDFVTLNLYQAISFAFFGHEPLARYLFLEVLRPLANSGFENQLSPSGKQLWSRVQEDIKQKKLREPDQWRALAVVYPSHPNTAAVVDKLLSCFTEDAREELRCRFIPVLPVRRRQGRGAMLLSPLALERIANLFADAEARFRNVLFFDDAIVSGRTVREFSANLRAAGAEVVRMVAILDRLRLPSGGTKRDRLRFFWRWDLADLGTANSCTLCKALDLGRQFFRALSSKRAQERLRVWCEIWQPISPVSQWHRALRPTPLDSPLTKRLSFPKPASTLSASQVPEDSRRKVRLKDSSSVASYVAEIFTMTGLDDQALVLCAKAKVEGQPLPTEARIEIYASQVLLFGQEFGSDTLSEVLTQLLSAAAEEQGETTHTALAALVFLLSEGFTVDHRRILRTALRNASCQEHSANLDVQMALSNLIWNERLDGREFPSAQRLLTSSGTTIAERYDRLHLELASLDGDPHSTPLKRFQQASRTVTECPRRLEHALHSLDQHEDLLRHIDVAWARSPKAQDSSSAADGKRTKKEIGTQALAQAKATLDMDSSITAHRDVGFLQAREQMLDDIVETHKTLESFQCQDLTENPAAEKAHSKAVDSVKKVRDGMTKLTRRFLFLHMSRAQLFSNEDHPLENCLTELFNRPEYKELFKAKGIEKRALTFDISMNSDIQIPERIHSVDLVWDRHVEDAVEHFMSNTIYALEVRIPDPWQRRPDEIHDLWASITYGENAAEIHLCNACNIPAKAIETELLKKCGRWHRIEEVGGTVQFGPHELVANTFQVSLSIPYAGYCRSLRTARHT